MSTENVKVTYTLSRNVTNTLQAMSDHTKKDVNFLVETALKFFIATHNDYLGQTVAERDEGSSKKS